MVQRAVPVAGSEVGQSQQIVTHGDAAQLVHLAENLEGALRQFATLLRATPGDMYPGEPVGRLRYGLGVPALLGHVEGLLGHQQGLFRPADSLRHHTRQVEGHHQLLADLRRARPVDETADQGGHLDGLHTAFEQQPAQHDAGSHFDLRVVELAGPTLDAL